MTIDEINAVLEAMTRFARIWLRQSAKDGSVSASDIISCKALLEKWKNNMTVKKGEYIVHEDVVYKAKNSHTSIKSPDSDTDNWEPVVEKENPEFNAKDSVDLLKYQQDATNNAVLGLMNMIMAKP